MKRLILSIAMAMAWLAKLAMPIVAFAQALTFPGAPYYAADYGQWVIKGQSPNTYQFSPASYCQVPQVGGGLFVPFATTAPVYIQDATAQNSEVVTPSGVITGTYCGVTMSPGNQHYSFALRSGTGGLQEALNTLAIGGTAYPAAITLDRNWYALAGSIPGSTPAGILGAVTGNAHAFLIDNTTAGPTFYVWNGTAYAAGTWVNTAPAAAAGTGAGTGPTIGDAGSALAQTVSLTAGTTTATGPLFTLTWATSSQFAYAPTGCTVTSTGANAFTAFTSASSYGSGHAVLTVTATAAPTAGTAYAFSVTGCK